MQLTDLDNLTSDDLTSVGIDPEVAAALVEFAKGSSAAARAASTEYPTGSAALVARSQRV